MLRPLIGQQPPKELKWQRSKEELSSEEKEAILKRVQQRCVYMRKYRGCGQCSLLALQEELSLSSGHLRCVELAGKAARLAAEAILELPRR